MASQVDIINLALTRLAVRHITTIDDASEPARQAKLVWGMIRQSVLRDHPWGFALKSGASVPGWSYAYLYPSDCLKVVKLYSESDTVSAQNYKKTAISGAEGADDYIVLACNTSGAIIDYIADIDKPALFDSMFIDALALRLAAELAKPLTGDNSKRQAMLQEYFLALDAAKVDDAKESKPINNTAAENPFWNVR
jgi:hypothetical protein